MITEFSDEMQHDAFKQFQEWRIKNPDGFFVTPKKKGYYNFHHVGCHHVGSPFWDGGVGESGDTQHSTTSRKKICSTIPSELLKWLSDRDYSFAICKHCINSRNPGHLEPSRSAQERMDGWLESWDHWTESYATGERATEDEFDDFDKQVQKSLRDDKAARQARLAQAPVLPEKLPAISFLFRRNPDVVAEVLLRANGKCEKCCQPAPFVRASDGTPYLEVHHRVMLSRGGEDTVANAVALCPNCHREAHFG